MYGLLMRLYGWGARLRGIARSKKDCYGLDFPTSEKPVVWFHAVSLGETKAIAPLARRFKADHPDHCLIISFITDTGHAEAKKSIPEADHHVYLPLDIPSVMRRVVSGLKPSLLVMSETDYWPAFMREVKRHGGRILVANAKLSERSARRHRRFPFISRRLLHPVDHFCLQSPIYAERLTALGIPSSRFSVTGNVKFDLAPTPLSDPDGFRASLRLSPSERVVTIGSTHAPEEAQLLPLLFSQELKILLVPRHPDRFDEVAQLLDRLQINYGRYSQRDALTGSEKVLLIDAMGLLNACYQISSAAIVAGSFTPKVGGHNILEPMWFGTPTLFGPHMHSQADMASLVLDHSAGERVSLDSLAPAVDRILSDPSASNHLAAASRTLLDSVSGSLERTYRQISLLVSQKK